MSEKIQIIDGIISKLIIDVIDEYDLHDDPDHIGELILSIIKLIREAGQQMMVIPNKGDRI